MPEKKLTLTIVIPAYNEERYIAACLDSIAALNEKPDEVILVDNNSTDKTLAIAKKYKFVKILHEKRQHQSFAQATGFNTATSDILGRIDADSVLPPDWVSKIKNAFEDKNVVAVTGGAEPYDVPFKWIGFAIFHGYFYTSSLVAGIQLLWGANCAVKRSAWRKIKNKVLLRPDIFEDYDLAFCLSRIGVISYIPGMRMGVSFRALHTTFSKHVEYQLRSVRTFHLRASRPRYFLFILLWSLTFLVYPLAVIDDWLLRRRLR